MRFALDTNILVYAEATELLPEDREKPARIQTLLAVMSPHEGVVPVQVLGEFYRVLVGKRHRTAAEAMQRVLGWAYLYEIADTPYEALLSAIDLSIGHALSSGMP